MNFAPSKILHKMPPWKLLNLKLFFSLHSYVGSKSNYYYFYHHCGNLSRRNKLFCNFNFLKTSIFEVLFCFSRHLDQGKKMHVMQRKIILKSFEKKIQDWRHKVPKIRRTDIFSLFLPSERKNTFLPIMQTYNLPSSFLLFCFLLLLSFFFSFSFCSYFFFPFLFPFHFLSF